MDGGKKRNLVIGVIVFLVIAIVWYAQNGDGNGASGSSEIETVSLELGDVKQTVATSGAVRPLITVEVGSQLSGQVAEIFVDFNSPVEKDQVIALIDPKSFESRVLQSKADLAVANANITVQQANIDRAVANLRKARLEYERSEPLAKQGTLSASEFDAALANFESAKADLTVAEAQLENARANHEQRQASLESAEIDLERTRIRAPIDGVVIERAVDKGQTVAASLSSPILFNIAQDLTEVQIEANVDEADIGNVKEGNEATFSVDAYPETEFSGLVEQVRLAPLELNNVVTYTVIITASNSQLKLLPGMTAIVEIVTGNSENVLRVSNEAVRFKPARGSELANLTAASAGSSGGPPGGSGGGMGDISRLQTQLNLDDNQVRVIEGEMQAIFTEIRSQFQGGGGGSENIDMDTMRAQMRQRISAVFDSNLTAEQFRQYQQIQRQAEQTRQGQLWIQSDDGEIKPVGVRFGISDDKYTQIFSRDLAAGDQAVARIRTAGN